MRRSLWLLSLVTFASWGCDKSTVPVADNGYRQQFLTNSLDATPSTIAAVLQQDSWESPVTVVGRIYGGDQNPFDAKSASFTVVERPEAGHDHEDPSDCVFCKRKLADGAMAVVKLVDPNGKPISQSADQLLGLKKNQDVIVQGKPSKVGDLLVIAADKIQIVSR
jgi:hypothetical protein